MLIILTISIIWVIYLDLFFYDFLSSLIRHDRKIALLCAKKRSSNLPRTKQFNFLKDHLAKTFYRLKFLYHPPLASFYYYCWILNKSSVVVVLLLSLARYFHQIKYRMPTTTNRAADYRLFKSWFVLSSEILIRLLLQTKRARTDRRSGDRRRPLYCFVTCRLLFCYLH